MYDGTKRQTISPGGGEVGDLHAFVRCSDLLGPGKKLRLNGPIAGEYLKTIAELSEFEVY